MTAFVTIDVYQGDPIDPTDPIGDDIGSNYSLDITGLRSVTFRGEPRLQITGLVHEMKLKPGDINISVASKPVFMKNQYNALIRRLRLQDAVWVGVQIYEPSTGNHSR